VNNFCLVAGRRGKCHGPRRIDEDDIAGPDLDDPIVLNDRRPAGNLERGIVVRTSRTVRSML